METIRYQLRTFIVDYFLFGDDKGFDDSVSFLESGIIDSTGILELIGFIQDKFNVKVLDNELIPENLDSIYNIIGFLDRKLGSAGNTGECYLSHAASS